MKFTNGFKIKFINRSLKDNFESLSSNLLTASTLKYLNAFALGFASQTHLNIVVALDICI